MLERNIRLSEVIKLQRELDNLQLNLAERKKVNSDYYGELTAEKNKSAIDNITLIAERASATNTFYSKEILDIINIAQEAKQALDNVKSPDDVQALYDFKMFTYQLAEACVAFRVSDKSEQSTALTKAIKAIPYYDLIRNQSLLCDKSSLDKSVSKIEDKINELRDAKLNSCTRTELIQESLDDLDKSRFKINNLNFSETFTSHVLNKKKIPYYIESKIHDPLPISKNSFTHLERVDIRLNGDSDPDAIIVTEYRENRDENKEKTYQLISDRIIILNAEAEDIFLNLDSGPVVDKKYGKTIQEVNEELNNEKLLKQFICDLDTLSKKEILIWEDSNQILDPTILLKNANSLADSQHHRDWTLLKNSLQAFVDFIHFKTDEGRTEEHDAIRKKYEKIVEKDGNSQEAAEVKSVEAKYNAIDMREAAEFETTFNFNILKTTLQEIEAKSCEQEFNIACDNLEVAIKKQEQSEDPVLRELGATGRKSLNLAKGYTKDNEIKGKDLEQYTNWVNKITKVVSNPNNHGQDFTEDMKLGNDGRAGEIFWGLTCIALGLAAVAASIAFAVLTCGAGSGFSIGGVGVGAFLAAAGSTMLGFKIGAIALGVVGGIAGAATIYCGTNMTFFENKGRFGMKADEVTAKAAQAVRNVI